jgi:UDP-glucose 6-dehydrogenase
VSFHVSVQVVQINDYQKQRFVEMVISAMFNTISGKSIAVLGFAFKKARRRSTRPSLSLDWSCRLSSVVYLLA